MTTPKTATAAKRTRRPATAKTATTAKTAPKAATAKPAAAKTAKFTDAELRAKVPAGYELKWPHGQHALLAKTDKAAADAPAWLVLCNAHGTTTPAKAAKEGERLGTREQRATWCAACKREAAKAAAAK